MKRNVLVEDSEMSVCHFALFGLELGVQLFVREDKIKSKTFDTR